MMTEASTQSESRKHRRPVNEQPGGFDSELNWWLNNSQSMMGERGGGLEVSEQGKCSGTKGTFRTFRDIFQGDVVFGYGTTCPGLIARANKCRRAWRTLTGDCEIVIPQRESLFVPHRDVLLARYLFAVDPSQKGLHGAAGDVAGVVMLLASRREHPDKELEKVAETQGWEAYAKAVRKKTGLIAQAIEACRICHIAWRDCRIEADREGRQ